MKRTQYFTNTASPGTVKRIVNGKDVEFFRLPEKHWCKSAYKLSDFVAGTNMKRITRAHARIILGVCVR